MGHSYFILWLGCAQNDCKCWINSYSLDRKKSGWLLPYIFSSSCPRKSQEAPSKSLFRVQIKVRTFWEAHIIWKKSSSWFWRLQSKSADLSKPWGRLFQILCVSQKVRTFLKGRICMPKSLYDGNSNLLHIFQHMKT